MNMSRRSLIVALVASIIAPGKANAAPRRPAPPRAPKPTPMPRISIPAAAARSTTVQASARNGGHLHKHVAQPPQYIRNRTTSEHARFTFGGAAMGLPLAPNLTDRTIKTRRLERAMKTLSDYRARPKLYSTFTSPTVTDAMYGAALRNNRTKVANWLRDPNQRKGITVAFSSNRDIGMTYRTTGVGRLGSYSPARSGVFVLEKAADGSFYANTAKLY